LLNNSTLVNKLTFLTKSFFRIARRYPPISERTWSPSEIILPKLSSCAGFTPKKPALAKSWSLTIVTLEVNGAINKLKLSFGL